VAQILKGRYYVDPATGKRVKKSFPGARQRKSTVWWIRYYTPDGRRLWAKGFKDRKATEALAVELERRGQREAAGIADPADEHAKRPLAAHVADFRRYLAAKGNTALYVKLALFRLNALLDGCGFVRMSDLQPSAVVEFLSSLRQKGKSVKTANEYLATAKSFTRWLARDRRLAVDPLACLSRLAGGAADVRHGRRDYSPEELHWLLEITRQSARPFRLLSGPDRHMIYLTAAATGFRTSELASMTPESFELEGDTPTATVQAACTKNRRQAVQPLPVDVAGLLRAYLRDKPAGKPVWPGTWSHDASAKMIRRDLADARKAWVADASERRQRAEREQSDFLAHRGADGRFLDFHGLRHTYITMVGKSGVSAREHMDLARHSSYAMTARYSHSRFYDLAAAVQALPIPVNGPAPAAEAVSATGTDGPICLSPSLSPQTEKTSEEPGRTGTISDKPDRQKNPEKPSISGVFPGKDKRGRNWRRRELNPRLGVLQRSHLRV
jgi:integrase